jgi:hypothetical protein
MSRKTIKSFTRSQAYQSGKKALVEAVAGGAAFGIAIGLAFRGVHPAELEPATL